MGIETILKDLAYRRTELQTGITSAELNETDRPLQSHTFRRTSDHKSGRFGKKNMTSTISEKDNIKVIPSIRLKERRDLQKDINLQEKKLTCRMKVTMHPDD